MELSVKSNTTRITYAHLNTDIHKKILSYLFSDFLNTEAIINANRLGLTCKTQYSLLFDSLKTAFKEFIFSDIKFDQYTINDPLLNMFIRILPTNHYLLLLEQLKNKATSAFDQLRFIDEYSNLSEKKINKSIYADEKDMVNQNNQITQLSSEIKKTSVETSSLIILRMYKKLHDLKYKLKQTKNKKKLAKSDLEKIKTIEDYKTKFQQNDLFKKFYTQDSSTSSNANWPSAQFFKNWIDAKIDLMYVFCARKLLEQFLYTDEYYQEHAKIIKKRSIDLDTNNIITKIKDLINNQEEEKIILHATAMILTNIWDVISYNVSFKSYMNLRFFIKKCTGLLLVNQKIFLQHKPLNKIITLPRYVYGLDSQHLYINAHWVNALYTLYKKTGKGNFFKREELQRVLQSIESTTQKTNGIILRLNRLCNVQYNMYKLMQYINDHNTSGSTVTIKTVDGIDHFTKYNQRFLHCLQNNQYPNITCVFQVPKAKETETNSFFNKKPWLNWYNTLYYLNQDIGKGPTTWSKLFEEKRNDFIGFGTKSGLLLFMWATLCILQEDQSIISTSFVPCSLVLHMLGFIGSTANEGSFLKHTVGAIPWYIIHALLRDSLLLYSIYQYRKINYLVTAYTLFELCMVQKSLFYKPLFEALCKQYKEKNKISIVVH